MTAPQRARPCPLCEAERPAGHDLVVSLYREQAFAEHCLVEHSGFDWRTAWAMPLPTHHAAQRPRL